MTPRKSPAQGEAPIVPGKVDRPPNTTPVTAGLPADAGRVTRPHLRLEPSDLPGWWKVMLVPADRRETKRLSSWPTRSEAAEAARAEADHRGLPVPAAAIMGGVNV